jgi:hypothetical protein
MVHAADGRVLRETWPIGTSQLDMDVVDLPAGIYTRPPPPKASAAPMRFVKQ